MAKIRKFKIEVRPRELERRAKKAKLSLADAGLGTPDAVSAFCAEVQKTLAPAVVYRSFGPDHAHAKLAPMSGLAFSLGVASLGSGPDELAARFLASPDHARRGPLVRLAAEASLEEAVGFVLSLLKQDADAETCDLSPISRLEDTAALEAACPELGVDRIGVSIGEGRLAPDWSAAFSVSWVARPRSKKTAKR